jgi:hypothetical protein
MVKTKFTKYELGELEENKMVPSIGELRNLEEQGRELATDLKLKGVSDKLLDTVDEWRYRVGEASENIAEKIDREEKISYDMRGVYRSFATHISFLSGLMMEVMTGCFKDPWYESGVPWGSKGHTHDGECIVTKKGDEELHEEISDMNTISDEMVSGPCATTYTALEIKKKPYSLSAFVNDYTQCYHRLLEEYDKLIKIKRETIGKCMIEEGSDKSLIESCKRWDKTTGKFERNGLYSRSDYSALHAGIFGNKGEFTVGDSPGHRTHLNLDKGTVEYYDTDVPVNETMKMLFESAGLKCKINKTTGTIGGVTCSGLNRKNVEEVGEKMAAATSMDFRVYGPADYWKPLSKKLPGLKKCHIYNTRPEKEACYVQTKIKANE